ncbi:hypothetical protein QWI17_19055 [Gilvimarinus sp. SDUM040013]|uniref:Uncharacterized protein n=1 Tax=Gilvimarinus gilvus TaxID=3058038 RepID=A0ABU4RYH7_9GAMM|nr:hypothetical protein [Gilvimarinus sp. SDUM040013]MDO3387951.1 hypothetical protein [Gilvimarinus sp. SDUM040013]MDX6848678.1 hypothetical protein [Gilvimarinus sp. SDUM040013]
MTKRFIYENELPKGYSILSIRSSSIREINGERNVVDEAESRKLIFDDTSYDYLVAESSASFSSTLDLLQIIANYLDAGLPLPKKLAAYMSTALKATVVEGRAELEENKGLADEVITNTVAATLAFGLNIKARNKRPLFSSEIFWEMYEEELCALTEKEWQECELLVEAVGDYLPDEQLSDYSRTFKEYDEARRRYSSEALRLAAREAGVSLKTAKRYLCAHKESVRNRSRDNYLVHALSSVLEEKDKSP